MELYKRRNLIERAFAHIKDWRRVATRYDKLARNFRSAVAIAAIVIWWINSVRSLGRDGCRFVVASPTAGKVRDKGKEGQGRALDFLAST